MRRIVTVCAILAVCACNKFDTTQPTIPDGAIVYRFAPTLLRYTGVDTTHNFDLHLTWLPLEPFFGWTCIALSPRTPTDTIGNFVFVILGANTGRVERIDHGLTDTTAGIFIPDSLGNRGTFAVTSTGQLKLFWTTGVPKRYFDPAASIRLANDTIFSDVVRKSNADSVQDNWQVRWVRGDCN